MAERNYKVNEPITIVYQAPNKESGATIIAEIYLPSGSKDSNFPDITLTERGSTGTYVDTFTPDQAGEWQVIIHKDDDTGQVTKRYSVGIYNVESVGQETSGVKSVVDGIDSQLDTVETKVDAIDTKVSSLDTPPMVS